MSVSSTGALDLTFRGAYSFAGVGGDASDIVRCDPVTTGPASSCTASVLLDGSTLGIASERLDAISHRPT